MNFYKKQHNFYCGIDLHAKTMYICIIDSNGNVKLHKNIKGGLFTCPFLTLDFQKLYFEQKDFEVIH